LVGYGAGSLALCVSAPNIWFLLWSALYTASFALVATLSIHHSRFPIRPSVESASGARTFP